jgi:hypothetical protein
MAESATAAAVKLKGMVIAAMHTASKTQVLLTEFDAPETCKAESSKKMCRPTITVVPVANG